MSSVANNILLRKAAENCEKELVSMFEGFLIVNNGIRLPLSDQNFERKSLRLSDFVFKHRVLSKLRLGFIEDLFNKLLQSEYHH